jgi:3-hydroxypropanoate dehydrogenase
LPRASAIATIGHDRQGGRMIERLSEEGQDLIFRAARTHNGWLDKPVPDSLLRQIYDLAKWGATSANCFPIRIVFAKSAEAKERLRPALSGGNTQKTMAAPVCAIFAYDTQFYENLPRLFPHNQEAISWFKGPDKAGVARATAFRNGTLQAAYFMIAARALGLDCGPMSGFDNALVDKAFFSDGRFKSNFLCNLGYGDPKKLHPRGPRPAFDEVCIIA